MIPYSSCVDYCILSTGNTFHVIDYFKVNPEDEKLLVKIFKHRKEWKGLQTMPDTVACRTSILPSPMFIESLGYEVKDIAMLAGLKLKYDYLKSPLEFDSFSPLEMIRDTREQEPLDLGCETIDSKLDFGDYCSKSHYKNVFVDRKSLPDLIQTLSSGFDRFNREFERAKAMGAYIVVGVEDSLENLLKLPFIEAGRHTKCSPEFICSRIRELCQNHNTQLVFCKNRAGLVAFIKKIFLCKQDVKTLDLQYFLDGKRF